MVLPSNCSSGWCQFAVFPIVTESAKSPQGPYSMSSPQQGLHGLPYWKWELLHPVIISIPFLLYFSHMDSPVTWRSAYLHLFVYCMPAPSKKEASQRQGCVCFVHGSAPSAWKKCMTNGRCSINFWMNVQLKKYYFYWEERYALIKDSVLLRNTGCSKDLHPTKY